MVRECSGPFIFEVSTSMSVTDVGDETCWQQFGDVGDSFHRFRHQHPLSFNTSVDHQHHKDHQYRNSVTNTQKVSPTSTCDHIYVAF